jgi:hypothetical protein
MSTSAALSASNCSNGLPLSFTGSKSSSAPSCWRSAGMPSALSWLRSASRG